MISNFSRPKSIHWNLSSRQVFAYDTRKSATKFDIAILYEDSHTRSEAIRTADLLAAEFGSNNV